VWSVLVEFLSSTAAAIGKLPYGLAWDDAHSTISTISVLLAGTEEEVIVVTAVTRWTAPGRRANGSRHSSGRMALPKPGSVLPCGRHRVQRTSARVDTSSESICTSMRFNNINIHDSHDTIVVIVIHVVLRHPSLHVPRPSTPTYRGRATRQHVGRTLPRPQ